MKKYKVITDAFDWHGVLYGEILYVRDGEEYPIVTNKRWYPLFSIDDFNSALNLHPGWLEDVSDDQQLEYTENDLSSYGWFMFEKGKRGDDASNTQDAIKEWSESKLNIII